MKRSVTAVAIFICTLFFNNLCPSTYNHARLAQLLKKLDTTHKISQDFKHEVASGMKSKLKDIEIKSPDDFEGRLDVCLQLLSQYDHLWEQLRDVLRLPKDGDLVDAVATVIDQVRLARSLLCNLADYAEENKELEGRKSIEKEEEVEEQREEK